MKSEMQILCFYLVRQIYKAVLITVMLIIRVKLNQYMLNYVIVAGLIITIVHDLHNFHILKDYSQIQASFFYGINE